MNRYDLAIRGEQVHLEFTRINDSRRLHPHFTQKRPNLFGVQCAMQCRGLLPPSMASPWWKENYPEKEYPFQGAAFCSRKDEWSALKGRHTALHDALRDRFDYLPGLADEIVAAFTAEEARRTKVKGLARKPKTAKPKARQRPSMRQILMRLQETLEKISPPMMINTNHISKEDWDRAVQQTLTHIQNRPIVQNIRPADTATATPSPHEVTKTNTPKENQ